MVKARGAGSSGSDGELVNLKGWKLVESQSRVLVMKMGVGELGMNSFGSLYLELLG